MTIPKNKKRTVHIDEIEYEWCATNPGMTSKGEKKIDIYIKNIKTGREMNIGGNILDEVKPSNIVKIIEALKL